MQGDNIAYILAQRKQPIDINANYERIEAERQRAQREAQYDKYTDIDKQEQMLWAPSSAYGGGIKVSTPPNNYSKLQRKNSMQ